MAAELNNRKEMQSLKDNKTTIYVTRVVTRPASAAKIYEHVHYAQQVS